MRSFIPSIAALIPGRSDDPPAGAGQGLRTAERTAEPHGERDQRDRSPQVEERGLAVQGFQQTLQAELRGFN